MENDEKYRILKAKVESFWENSNGILYKDNILYNDLADADVCIGLFESFITHSQDNNRPLFFVLGQI